MAKSKDVELSNEKKIISDEQKVSLFDYATTTNLLLERSKEDLDVLQHKKTLLNIQINQLQQALIAEQNRFEQWKRGEVQKFNDEKNKIKNDQLAKERAMDIGLQEHTKRMGELEIREKNAMNIIEETNKLNAKRIDVERLNVRATDLMKDADAKISDALSRLTLAVSKELKFAEEKKQYDALNSDLAIREQKLSEEKSAIEARFKNLEELKNTVEPKIRELSLMEENRRKELVELKDKEADVLRKYEECKAIMRGIEDREAKVKVKERELLSKEEEIMRKALLAGIK